MPSDPTFLPALLRNTFPLFQLCIFDKCLHMLSITIYCSGGPIACTTNISALLSTIIAVIIHIGTVL